jgi:hypothetical protein
MAQQLVESIAQQKALVGQQARLEERARIQVAARSLISYLRELATFTGNDWEQEDDVTLVALSHR